MCDLGKWHTTFEQIAEATAARRVLIPKRGGVRDNVFLLEDNIITFGVEPTGSDFLLAAKYFAHIRCLSVDAIRHLRHSLQP
jgi:hypothetical protein